MAQFTGNKKAGERKCVSKPVDIKSVQNGVENYMPTHLHMKNIFPWDQSVRGRGWRKAD
jgi:hypothetical protein